MIERSRKFWSAIAQQDDYGPQLCGVDLIKLEESTVNAFTTQNKNDKCLGDRHFIQLKHTKYRYIKISHDMS